MNDIQRPPFTIWVKKQVLLFSKFGTIGLFSAFVDIFLFNILVGVLKLPSLESKFVSGVFSTLLAWMGNRYWTFRKYRRSQRIVEAIEYFVVAAGGLFISLFCLWISHYLLGFTSLLADNIAGNFIGLIFATGFRFFGNQYWVFSSKRKHHTGNKVDSKGN